MFQSPRRPRGPGGFSLLRRSLLLVRYLLSVLLVLSAAASAVEPDRAELHVTTSPPGAAITLDGALVGLSPRTETLSPGVHTLTAELSGALTSQTVSLVAGATRAVTLSLVPLTPPARPFPVIGTVTFGGGALALGVGLLLRFPAQAAGRAVSGLSQRGGSWDDQARELEAAGLRAQSRSWFFTGAGLAVMASGLIVAGLEWFGHRTGMPALVLLPTAGGGMLSWGARW